MAQTLPVTREVLGSRLCLTVVFLTEGMLAQQDSVLVFIASILMAVCVCAYVCIYKKSVLILCKLTANVSLQCFENMPLKI